MPLEGLPEGLQGNEALNNFNDVGGLAQAFVDMHGRVSSGSIELIPEEIRKDPSMAAFKNIGDVAKSYIETKKMVGSIEKAPARPEDYKFSPVEGIDPNVKLDPEGLKLYTQDLHKLGLGPKVADGVYKANMLALSRAITAGNKAKEDRAKETQTALLTEWGGEENYNKNVDAICKVLNKAGGSELIGDVAEFGSSLKKHPSLLKGLSKIVGLLSEDAINSLDSGSSSSGGGGGANAEDLKKYDEYAAAIASNDPKHAISNENDPKHADAVKEWTRLCQVKFGGKAN